MRTFLIHLGLCQHYYITIQPTSIVTWGIFAEKCSHEELRTTLISSPPQAKIRSKAYLNTPSNSMALFQTTYYCIFTSSNLPNCCKGLKSYCINKSLAPLGSNMSTTQSLLLLIITQRMVKNATSQWPMT